jgi:hypothetical protein
MDTTSIYKAGKKTNAQVFRDKARQHQNMTGHDVTIGKTFWRCAGKDCKAGQGQA